MRHLRARASQSPTHHTPALPSQAKSDRDHASWNVAGICVFVTGLAEDLESGFAERDIKPRTQIASNPSSGHASHGYVLNDQGAERNVKHRIEKHSAHNYWPRKVDHSAVVTNGADDIRADSEVGA